MHFRTATVGDFETEAVVLHVGEHLGMRLGHAAELRFPIAIENDPVDVAARGAGLIAIGS